MKEQVRKEKVSLYALKRYIFFHLFILFRLIQMKVIILVMHSYNKEYIKKFCY
jgi:hypothetical protein